MLSCPILRPGVFKASSFYEMLERLWAAMFDLLLKMSNMFKDRRCAHACVKFRQGAIAKLACLRCMFC